MEVKAEYRAAFTEEAKEHLEQWEQALLALERAPGDMDLVHQLFRSVHTLKGSAGFIGLEDLQRLEHELDSALACVREGASTLTPLLSDALFRGLDLSRRMVESFAQGTPCNVDIDAFLGGLKENLAPQPTTAAAAPSAAEGAAVATPAGPACGLVYVVSLAITAPPRESYLRALLARTRASEVGRVISEHPSPEALKGSAGPFSYRITLESGQGETAVRDAFDFDQVEVLGISLQSEAASVTAPAQDPSADVRPATSRASLADEVVRVSVERLDALLNLVGELVIQSSGFYSLRQRLREARGRDPVVMDLEEKTESLGKITRDLQDGIMKVRMLPVNNVFSRFHRVVRDLSRVSGKDVELQISGEETEIDKKVMDRLGDPLVHLVRNAVDHGLEAREDRLAAGKEPVGIVRLGAYQDGDRICIEIADDGRGLDRDSILAKGLEKALVKAEEVPRLSDAQVFGLIFLPGFSTARKVTEVSGRGVGMDVVRREIEELGGSVRVRSARGRGTVVTLSLPLTMAIVSAVLVEVSGSTFAVPLSSVREVLKVDPDALDTVGGRKTVRLRDEILSLVPLDEALRSDGGHSLAAERDVGKRPVVVVDHDSRKIGLAVDRVTGTGEIVIKSLSRHYREIDGLVGASILGNGRIALIVDVEAMVRQYYRVDGPGGSGAATVCVAGRDDWGQRARAAAESEHPVATPLEPPTAAPEAAPPLPAPATSALLQEIHNAGAVQASIALCQLTGEEVRVSFPDSEVVPLAEVAEALGGEQHPVGGIYVGLAGDLKGGLLVVLPTENLARLHEVLHRLPSGACTSLEQVDMSAVQELGNVVAASFVNAMADSARLAVRCEPPESSVDMCLAVVDSVLARFNQPGDRLLLTKAVVFSGRLDQVVCHLLLLLEPESLARLVAALERPAE